MVFVHTIFEKLNLDDNIKSFTQSTLSKTFIAVQKF